MDESNHKRRKYEAQAQQRVGEIATESVRDRCKRLYAITGAPTYLLAYERIVDLEQQIERLSKDGKKLQWHYGPTATDSDPGKMWCKDCGGEVYAFEEGFICSKCSRSEDHEQSSDGNEHHE